MTWPELVRAACMNQARDEILVHDQNLHVSVACRTNSGNITGEYVYDRGNVLGVLPSVWWLNYQRRGILGHPEDLHLLALNRTVPNLLASFTLLNLHIIARPIRTDHRAALAAVLPPLRSVLGGNTQEST